MFSCRNTNGRRLTGDAVVAEIFLLLALLHARVDARRLALVHAVGVEAVCGAVVCEKFECLSV